MTGKIINLRGERKRRARDAGRLRGDENAAKFSRTRAEKELEKARAEKTARDLDGHERE